MCLIITAVAAEISTLIWYLNDNRKELKLAMLMYMFFGATIMWLIDGFYCLAEGEAFLDLSADDAALGVVVVICAVAVWLVALIVSGARDKIKAKN